VSSTHTEHEDMPWTDNIANHPVRADSKTYREARPVMITMARTVQPWFLGDPPWQDHHGGGLWLHDGDGWLLVCNVVGAEWSSQFAGDPAKFDWLRRNAERLTRGFPRTEPELLKLGLPQHHLDILHTPITDADGIGRYVDSIWNASVPLPAAFHTATLHAGDHQHAGVHHYPKPIVDIQWFKRDDFVLFIPDQAGHAVAVAPVAPRGSGDGRVQVLWAHPASEVGGVGSDAVDAGIVLDPQHPVARAAFARQRPAA
jgi:hypothetical protein